MVLKRVFFSSLLLHCHVVLDALDALDALDKLLNFLLGRDHPAYVVFSHCECFCVALNCEINVEITIETCVCYFRGLPTHWRI